MWESYNVREMTSFLLECLHFPPLCLVSVPRLKGVIILKGLMGLRADTEIGFVMVGREKKGVEPLLKGSFTQDEYFTHVLLAAMAVEALVIFSTPPNHFQGFVEGKNSAQCQYNGRLRWPSTKTTANKHKHNSVLLLGCHAKVQNKDMFLGKISAATLSSMAS